MGELSEKGGGILAPEQADGPTPAKTSSEEPAKDSILVGEKQAPRVGADAALELLRETGGLHQTLDPEVNRRLVRRIDTHIMPLICIIWLVPLNGIATSFKETNISLVRDNTRLWAHLLEYFFVFTNIR